jgi:hypothetical protein
MSLLPVQDLFTSNRMGKWGQSGQAQIFTFDITDACGCEKEDP